MSNPTTALGRAIDAYIANDDTLTKAERAMLARLRVSGEAAEAFANLLLSGTKGLIFIRDCVVSHRYAHGEHAKQIEAFRSAPKPEKARAALAEVEHFFRGSLFETIPDSPPVFPDVPKTWEFARRPYISSTDPGPLGEAVALLAQAIDREKRLRKEYRKGISRKGDVEAADLRAIGWLKESVLRLSGRPNLEAVMAISSALLGLRDEAITPDHVKNATTPSEWNERRLGRRR